jgi:hypothetical protein
MIVAGDAVRADKMATGWIVSGLPVSRAQSKEVSGDFRADWQF